MSYTQAIGAINGVLDTGQAMDVPIAASAAVVNFMVSLKLPMATTEEAMRSATRQADLFAYSGEMVWLSPSTCWREETSIPSGWLLRRLVELLRIA